MIDRAGGGGVSWFSHIAHTQDIEKLVLRIILHDFSKDVEIT